MPFFELSIRQSRAVRRDDCPLNGKRFSYVGSNVLGLALAPRLRAAPRSIQARLLEKRQNAAIDLLHLSADEVVPGFGD
jgi:hypothetical protein